MLVVAKAIVFLVALFFLVLGAAALVRPGVVRTFLLGFANTAVMALVPWRVHDRFARSAVPKALGFLPLIGISSLLIGAALLWAMAARSAA